MTFSQTPLADLAAPVSGSARGTNLGSSPRPNEGGIGASGREGEAQPLASVPVLVVHVLGKPAPQGSKHGRPIYRGRGAAREFTGKVAQVESSKLLPSWREAVKEAAGNAIEQATDWQGTDWQPLTGALYVHTVYTFNRPKAHYRTGRYSHLLRDNAPAWPATHGNDIEKLDRGSRDALADVGVYVNDGLVVRHQSWKAYPGSHPDALPVAGAVIRVYRLPAEFTAPQPGTTYRDGGLE